MTQQRLSGIPFDDGPAMRAAGLDVDDDPGQGGAGVFFHQAFRDGYFHGDQHPGNMSVGLDGAIQVVDFGIMGRIDKKTRYFLADMLMGFVEHDYARIAKVYVDAGYLPASQSVEDFTLALALDRRADPWQAARRNLLRAHPRPDLRRGRDLRHGGAAAAASAAEEHADRRGRVAATQSAAQHLGPGAAADRAVDDRESRTRRRAWNRPAASSSHAVERLPAVMRNIDRLVGHLAEGGLKLDPEALKVINRTGSQLVALDHHRRAGRGAAVHALDADSLWPTRT